MPRAYDRLLDPLISYTCDVFREVTPEKLAAVRLTYEIMREAIADLHGDNKALSEDAKAYFKGTLFRQHCEDVGICEETMLYIVNNPHKYLTRMGVYGEERVRYESNIQF